MTAAIRVVVVDDDPLVRSALRLMLEVSGHIEVVAEGNDGTHVLPLVDRHRPDVVLMDIRMPTLDGIAATRLLRSQPAAPPVLVLTTFGLDEVVLEVLRAGAAGFLLKDTPPGDLIRAIERVHAGDSMLSPEVTGALIAHVTGDRNADERRARARTQLAVLTPREREVALAVAEGQPNARIALDLNLSLATVKAHVSSLLTKLDVSNRVQVALLIHDAES